MACAKTTSSCFEKRTSKSGISMILAMVPPQRQTKTPSLGELDAKVTGSSRATDSLNWRYSASFSITFIAAAEALMRPWVVLSPEMEYTVSGIDIPGLSATMTALASNSLFDGFCLWCMACNSQIRVHSKHSAHPAQFKQRFASRKAINVVYPVSTSSKLLIRFLIGSTGILRRLPGGILIFSISTSTGSGVWVVRPVRRSLPLRNRSIETAARRPSPTASTMDLGPYTASPPAKMPGIFVSRVRGSAESVFPSLPIPIRLLFSISRSGNWPIAGITVSTSIMNSDPSRGTGLALPDSSSFPSSIR